MKYFVSFLAWHELLRDVANEQRAERAKQVLFRKRILAWLGYYLLVITLRLLERMYP